MRSFNWILRGSLAGAGRPGLFNPLAQDLNFLRTVGIRTIVSLTRTPLELPSDSGFRSIHFPIPDMGIPTPRATLEICEQVLASMDQGEPVVLHCKAGLGRTGTLLACSLVSRGEIAERAVARIRNVTPYYIQTSSQETFVSHYAEFLQELAAGDGLPEGFQAPPVVEGKVRFSSA